MNIIVDKSDAAFLFVLMMILACSNRLKEVSEMIVAKITHHHHHSNIRNINSSYFWLMPISYKIFLKNFRSLLQHPLHPGQRILWIYFCVDVKYEELW